MTRLPVLFSAVTFRFGVCPDSFEVSYLIVTAFALPEGREMPIVFGVSGSKITELLSTDSMATLVLPACKAALAAATVATDSTLISESPQVGSTVMMKSVCSVRRLPITFVR